MLFTGIAPAQNQEHQRKFKSENIHRLSLKQDTLLSLGPFDLSASGVYQSMDLYLDTPNLDLHNHRLSLRIRRVIRQSGEVEFKLQLKNEMQSSKDARLEVEDEALERFTVRTDAGPKPLTALLDQVFNALHQNHEAHRGMVAMNDLQAWIRLESDGYIEPFQVLSDLTLPGLSSSVLSTLRPTLLIQGTRERMLVHTDASNLAHDSLKLVIPFNENAPTVLVAECSLDIESCSVLVGNRNAKVTLTEFEMEDKMDVPNPKVMDQLEAEVNTYLGKAMLPFIDSKYSQAVQALFKE